MAWITTFITIHPIPIVIVASTETTSSANISGNEHLQNYPSFQNKGENRETWKKQKWSIHKPLPLYQKDKEADEVRQISPSVISGNFNC